MPDCITKRKGADEMIASNKELVEELRSALAMMVNARDSTVRAAAVKVRRVLEALENRPNRGVKE